MSSLIFDHGDLQHSTSKTICQPTLNGMDHFFGFQMPGAKSPRVKPISFSYAPGEGSLSIMCPGPRPLKCELDKAPLAFFNRMEDREQLKRRTTSPFGTDSEFTNPSPDDISSVFEQNSPANNVAKLEDASFTHTPTSATFSPYPPFSWSSSSPSLFSSSASTCSSFSSCPPSTIPYNWSPSMNQSNEATFVSPEWPSEMPRFFHDGDQQYHSPTSADLQLGWEVSSSNEEMVRVLNRLHANNMHTGALSSSYSLGPFENAGIEPLTSLPRSQAMPCAYQSTATSIALPSQNEATSQILSQYLPQQQSQSQSQSLYWSPTNPNAFSSTTDTTNTASVAMNHPDNSLYQRQQQTQSIASKNITLAMVPEPVSETPQSTQTSSAPTPASASHGNRNAFLIDCKSRGLSYKDIKRLGNFREAESTLRGRYRTLTKSKDQRVRKPQWEEKDTLLLRDAVNKYSAKTRPNSSRRVNYSSGQSRDTPTAVVAASSTVSTGGAPKVSWKKVAQHIWAHGGSYHFGNATCKKKWCEINGIDGGAYLDMLQ